MDNDKQIIKTFLKASRNASLNTHDWLRDLIEKDALTLDDLREYGHDLVEARERLRMKLVERRNLLLEEEEE